MNTVIPWSYGTVHFWQTRARGKASLYPCVEADETCQGGMEWSIIHDMPGLSPEQFEPRCVSHHRLYDRQYPDRTVFVYAGVPRWTPEWEAKIAAGKTARHLHDTKSPEHRRKLSDSKRALAARSGVRGYVHMTVSFWLGIGRMASATETSSK